MRLVLAQNTDATHPRIDAIRQCKIDNAELAAKKHGRLGAPVGQLLESAAATTREHQRDGPLRQSLLDASARQHLRVPSTAVGQATKETVRDRSAGVNVEREAGQLARSAGDFVECLQFG